MFAFTGDFLQDYTDTIILLKLQIIVFAKITDDSVNAKDTLNRLHNEGDNVWSYTEPIHINEET